MKYTIIIEETVSEELTLEAANEVVYFNLKEKQIFISDR